MKKAMNLYNSFQNHFSNIENRPFSYKLHIFTDIDQVMNMLTEKSLSDSQVKICRKMRRSKILPHKGPCDEVQGLEEGIDVSSDLPHVGKKFCGFKTWRKFLGEDEIKINLAPLYNQ